MSWEKVKLGDICSKIGSGATPKGGSTVYIKNGTAFIRSQNIYNLSFDYNGLVFITDDAAKKLNGVAIQESDVLINITGDSVARTCIVPKSILPARVNQHVAIVRPNPDILNPFFLNYYLASPYMQTYMLGLAVGKGTSRNAMTKDMIANFEVPSPPIDIQNKIVNILSKYDALIENNQKQIKLLEEAAQRLYKEWFVDLRFPGYEDVEIVDGVPEGWKLCNLCDVVSINDENISKKYNYDYIDYVDLGSVSKGHIKTVTRYSLKDAPGRAKRVAEDGDVAWGMVRPNLESFAYVFNPTETMIFSTGFAILHPVKIPYAFLYCYVSTDGFVKYLINCTNGAAYPAVKTEHFEAAKILLASAEILNKFQSILEPIFRKIELLDKQNKELAEARDRLLPKLMSGELEV